MASSNNNQIALGLGMTLGLALSSTTPAAHHPSTIHSAFSLQDTYLAHLFLLVTAISALLPPTLRALHLLPFPSPTPRQPAALPHCGPYSANVAGGTLLGAGMALARSDPGLVLVQLGGAGESAGGVRVHALWVLLGCIAGGAVYSYPDATRMSIRIGRLTTKPLLYILVVFGVVGLALRRSSSWPGMVDASSAGPAAASGSTRRREEGRRPDVLLGGLAIGAVQALCIVFTGRGMGVSGAYEDAGAWIWWVLLRWLLREKQGHSTKKELTTESKKRPGVRAMVFAGGMVVGAVVWGAGAGGGGKEQVDVEVRRMEAFVGGMAMALGSRVAGGCTFGHGISGMGTMGAASFVTMAFVVVGGGAIAMLQP